MSENKELARQLTAEQEAKAVHGDHWELSSDIRWLNVVDDELMRRLTAAGYDQETATDLMLGAHEAIINAMRHGNQDQPDKKVKVDLQINPKLVQISIEDEGQGFDPTQLRVTDPMGFSGRGVDSYIKPYFEISYNEQGNKITLTKKENAGS